MSKCKIHNNLRNGYRFHDSEYERIMEGFRKNMKSDIWRSVAGSQASAYVRKILKPLGLDVKRIDLYFKESVNKDKTFRRISSLPYLVKTREAIPAGFNDGYPHYDIPEGVIIGDGVYFEPSQFDDYLKGKDVGKPTSPMSEVLGWLSGEKITDIFTDLHRVIRNRMSETRYFEEAVNALLETWGYKVVKVSKESFEILKRNHNIHYKTRAVIIDKTIYASEELSAETKIHEFLHPFVTGIYFTDRLLFEDLFKEAMNTGLYDAKYKIVSVREGDYNEARMEVVTSFLEDVLSGKLNKTSRSLIERIVKAIKMILYRIFGVYDPYLFSSYDIIDISKDTIGRVLEILKNDKDLENYLSYGTMGYAHTNIIENDDIVESLKNTMFSFTTNVDDKGMKKIVEFTGMLRGGYTSEGVGSFTNAIDMLLNTSYGPETGSKTDIMRAVLRDISLTQVPLDKMNMIKMRSVVTSTFQNTSNVSTIRFKNCGYGKILRDLIDSLSISDSDRSRLYERFEVKDDDLKLEKVAKHIEVNLNTILLTYYILNLELKYGNTGSFDLNELLLFVGADSLVDFISSDFGKNITNLYKFSERFIKRSQYSDILSEFMMALGSSDFIMFLSILSVHREYREHAVGSYLSGKHVNLASKAPTHEEERSYVMTFSEFFIPILNTILSSSETNSTLNTLKTNIKSLMEGMSGKDIKYEMAIEWFKDIYYKETNRKNKEAVFRYRRQLMKSMLSDSLFCSVLSRHSNEISSVVDIFSYISPKDGESGISTFLNINDFIKAMESVFSLRNFLSSVREEIGYKDKELTITSYVEHTISDMLSLFNNYVVGSFVNSLFSSFLKSFETRAVKQTHVSDIKELYESVIQEKSMLIIMNIASYISERMASSDRVTGMEKRFLYEFLRAYVESADKVMRNKNIKNSNFNDLKGHHFEIMRTFIEDHNIPMLKLLKRYMYAMTAYQHLFERSREILKNKGIDISNISSVRDLIGYINDLDTDESSYMWIVPEGEDEGLIEMVSFREYLGRFTERLMGGNVDYKIGSSGNYYMGDIERMLKFIEGDDNYIGSGALSYMKMSDQYGLGVLFNKSPHLVRVSEEYEYEGYTNFIHLITAESIMGSYISYINNIGGPAKYVTVQDIHALPIISTHYIYMLMATGEGQETASSGFANMLSFFNSIYGITFGSRNLSSDVRVRLIEHIRGKVRVEGFNNISAILSAITSIPNIEDKDLKRRGFMKRRVRIRYDQNGPVSDSRRAILSLLNIYLMSVPGADENLNDPGYIQKMRDSSSSLSALLRWVDGDFGKEIEKNKIYIYENESPISSVTYNDFKAIRSFFMEYVSTNISHTFNIRNINEASDRKQFVKRLNKIVAGVLGYYAADHMMGRSKESEAVLTLLAHMLGIPEDDIPSLLSDPIHYFFTMSDFFKISITKGTDGKYIYDLEFNTEFYKYDEDSEDIVIGNDMTNNMAFTEFVRKHVENRYHIVSESGSAAESIIKKINYGEFANHVIPLVINNMFGSDNTGDTFVSTFLQHMESYMPLIGYRYSNMEGSKFNLFTGLYEDIFYSILGRRYVAVNDFTHLLEESRRILTEAFEVANKEKVSKNELNRIVLYFEEAGEKLKRYESASRSIPDHGFIYGYRSVNSKLSKAYNYIVGKILDGDPEFINAFVTGYSGTPHEVKDINITSFIKIYTGRKYGADEGKEGMNIFEYYLEILSDIINKYELKDVVISILKSGEYESLRYDEDTEKIVLDKTEEDIVDYLWGSYELARFYTILIDSTGSEVRDILSNTFYGDLMILKKDGKVYHAKKPSLYNILEFMHSLPGVLMNGYISQTIRQSIKSESHSVFIEFFDKLLKDADLHHSVSSSGTLSEMLVSGGSKSFSKYKNLSEDMTELSAAYFAFVKSIARLTATAVPRVKIKPSSAIKSVALKVRNILAAYRYGSEIEEATKEEIMRTLGNIYVNYIEENIYVTPQFYGTDSTTEGTHMTTFYGNKDLLNIIGRSASYDDMFIDFGSLHLSRNLKAVVNRLHATYGSLMPFSLSRELKPPYIYGSNNINGVMHYNAVDPSVSSYGKILSDIHFKHVGNLFKKMSDPAYIESLRSHVHEGILKRYYERYLNSFHLRFIKSVRAGVEGLFFGNKNIGFGDVSEFRHIIISCLLKHMAGSENSALYEKYISSYIKDILFDSKVNAYAKTLNEAIVNMLSEKKWSDSSTSTFGFIGFNEKSLVMKSLKDMLENYVNVMSEIRHIQSELIRLRSVISRVRTKENIYMSASIRNKGIGIHRGMKVYLPGEDMNSEMVKESLMSIVSSLHNLFLIMYGNVMDVELLTYDAKGNHYIDMRKIYGKVNILFSEGEFLYADMVGILVSLGLLDSVGDMDNKSITSLMSIGDRIISKFDDTEVRRQDLYKNVSEFINNVSKLISDRFTNQRVLDIAYNIYNNSINYEYGDIKGLFNMLGITPGNDIDNISTGLVEEYMGFIRTLSTDESIKMDLNPSVSEHYNFIREHIAYNLISSLFKELHNGYMDFVSSTEHSLFVSEISKEGISGILSLYASIDPYRIFEDTENSGLAERPQVYGTKWGGDKDGFTSLMRVLWHAHQNSLPAEIRLGSAFPMVNYETHALEPVISSFSSLSEDETLRHYVFGRLGNIKTPGKADEGIGPRTVPDSIIALSLYNLRASNYANRVLFSYMMGNIADYLEIVQKGGSRDVSTHAPYYDFVVKRFVDDMSSITPISSISINKVRSAINNIRTSIVLRYIRAMMEGIPSGSAVSTINKAVTVVLFILSLYIFSFLSFDSILVVMSTVVFFFFFNLFGRSMSSAKNFWEHTLNYFASLTPALKHTAIITTSALLKPFNFIGYIRRIHEKLFDRGLWISQFLPVQEVYHFENKITHDFAHVDRSLSRFLDIMRLLRTSFRNSGIKSFGERATYSYLLSAFTNFILYLFNTVSHYSMLPKAIPESYINMFSLNYASRAVPLLKNQKVRIGDEDVVMDIYYHFLHFTRTGMLKNLKVKYKGKTYEISMSDDPGNPNRELAARIRTMIDDPQYNNTLSTFASFSSSYIPIRNVLIASIKSWASPFLRILYYLKSAVFPINYMLRNGSYNNVYQLKYMGLRSMGHVISTLFILSSLFALVFPFQQSWFVTYTILIGLAPIFYSALDSYYGGFVFGGMGRGSVLAFAKDYIRNKARIPILYSLTFVGTMLLSSMFRKALCNELGYNTATEGVTTGVPYNDKITVGVQTFMGPESLSYFCSSLVSADQDRFTFRSYYDSTRHLEGKDIESVSEMIKDMIGNEEDPEIIREHLIDLYHSALYNSCVFTADVMRAAIRKYMDDVLRWREVADGEIRIKLEAFYKDPLKIMEYEGRRYEEGAVMEYYPTFEIVLEKFPESGEDFKELKDFRAFLDYVEGIIDNFNGKNSEFVENVMVDKITGRKPLSELHVAIEDEIERLSNAVNTYRTYAENTAYFIEFMRTPQFIPSVNKSNALTMAYAIRSYMEEYGSAMTDDSQFRSFRDRVSKTLMEMEDKEFAGEVEDILWGKRVDMDKLNEARKEYEKIIAGNNIESNKYLKKQIAMYSFAWFLKNYRFYEQHKFIYSLREWNTFLIDEKEVARHVVNTLASYRNLIGSKSEDLMISFYDFPFLSGYGVSAGKTYKYQNMENLYKSLQNTIRLIPGIESFIINSRNYNSSLPHILKSNIETFPMYKIYTMRELWEMTQKEYGTTRRGKKENIYEQEGLDIISSSILKRNTKGEFLEKSIKREPRTNMTIEVRKISEK